jgi:hypothetical protein
MKDQLIIKLVQAVLLLLDHQVAQPSLERHNKVRAELRQALYEWGSV